MSDKLVKGIRYFEPSDKAPEWVIGQLMITLDEFKAFVNENADLLTDYQGKKQLKLTIARSKEGKPYLKVDTYKKEEKKEDLPF